jgi:CrcB protein
VSGTAWLAFLAAAGMGAPARYLVDGWTQDRTTGRFPWGTLTVNLSGCLLLGLVTGLALYHGAGTTFRTVAGTGGVGAYTTFSTFSFETVRLVEERASSSAMVNVAGSLVGGVAAASLGLLVMALV